MDPFTTDIDNVILPMQSWMDSEELRRRDNGKLIISLDTVAQISKFSTSPLQLSLVSMLSLSSGEDGDEGWDEDAGNPPGGPVERNAVQY
jgi:uncharacterized protein (DUF934 family)